MSSLPHSPSVAVAALLLLSPLTAQSLGLVPGHQKISATQGGFGGVLLDYDVLGRAVANVGDVDGDGVNDLAVSALGDDDGNPTLVCDLGGFLFNCAETGAVWILFMNPDGTVRAEQKISPLQGGFTGAIDERDFFGLRLAGLGDLDGDGVPDLAVGAPGDDDGG